MHPQTPFQFLPLHIVQLIVNHVVGSSRVLSDGILPDSKGYRMLLKPLLWTCHNFRTIALPLYCNCFNINIPIFVQGAQSDDELLPRCTGDACDPYNYLGHTTLCLAKELKVVLDERTVYSGWALEALSCAPYHGCSFPLVRKFTLILSADDDDESVEIDLSQAEANVTAFVERIKFMAPMVSAIRVQLLSLYSPETNQLLVGMLVSQLYQLAVHIEYDYADGYTAPIWQHLDMICNLTHIKYASVGKDEHFLHSVRRNASTLQALDMTSINEFVDIRGLIQNADDSYVSYPQLLKLYICWREGFDEHSKVFPRDVIPFPSIRQLVFSFEYPFGDDIAFRGNGSTLEQLDLRASSSVVTMLRRLVVFTPVSHPKLQYVSTVSYDEDIPELFDTPIDYAKFVLSIGPRAHTRGIGLEYVESSQLSALMSSGELTCIQVLKIPYPTLGLWDVFTLVKCLPLLSDLHTRTPTIGRFSNNATKDELLAHVFSNYTTMGKRFRFWFIDCSHYKYARSALCVLLLALVCPNFSHATTLHSRRVSLMKAMEEIIDSDAFKPYSLQLRRLLFSDWNGK